MKELRQVTGRAAVLDRADVDTDQIIPKQFLKRIERSGYGEFLFYDWMKDPAFELRRPEYQGASILVAGRNFGCGSSREHAAWALEDYGFRVVLAPSYARHLPLERDQDRHRADRAARGRAREDQGGGRGRERAHRRPRGAGDHASRRAAGAVRARLLRPPDADQRARRRRAHAAARGADRRVRGRAPGALRHGDARLNLLPRPFPADEKRVSFSSPGPRLAAVRWAWLAVVTVGMGFFVAHTTLDLGGPGLDAFTGTWVYDGLEVLALAAIAARAVLVPSERTVWALLAVAVAFWTLGDISWTAIYHDDPPFPSVADSFYLAFYPAAYLALALLVRHRVSRFNASVWLDGLAAALAVAALGAAVLLEVVINGNEGKLFAQATNLAYPLGDIVLFAFVVGVYAIAGVRLGRALGRDRRCACRLGDRRRDLPVPVGGRQLPVRDGARRALAGGAHPARPGRLERTGPAERGEAEGRPLAATPLLCGLVALGVLVDSYVEHRNVLGVTLAAAAILTVVARALITFRENVEISDDMRTLATTDALTGPRQPTQADRRPRRILRALCAGAAAVSPLRPERVQALQRHVRPPGRRRAACQARPAGWPRRSGSGGAATASVATSSVPSHRSATHEIEAFLDSTTGALTESSRGFAVSSAFGCAILPEEATTTEGRAPGSPTSDSMRRSTSS